MPSEKYLQEQIDALEQQLKDAARENLRLKVESRDRLSALRQTEQQLQSILQSSVWKLSAPLRRLESKLRSRRGGAPAPPAVDHSMAPLEVSNVIDVVIPIYRGLPETKRCFDSVFAHPQQTKFELVVVNDKSPEPELSEYLRSLRDAGKITLIENETNLGFAGAVTEGIRQHPDRDIILLNSDTMVHGNWLDRLVQCARNNPRVGTITPFSNNGAITSYPKTLAINDILTRTSLAELDTIFARTNAGKSVPLPVGVGFCMFISRQCFNAINGFDIDKFGAGYGEENDLCLRAEAAGFGNLLCADTFVFHEGAISFREREVTLKKKATTALLSRFPHYLERVAAYLSNDPAQPLRNAVDVARIESESKPGILAVVDAEEYNISRHLRETAKRAAANANTFCLQTINGKFTLFWLNPGEHLGMTLDLSSDADAVAALLKKLNVSKIEYYGSTSACEAVCKVAAILGVPIAAGTIAGPMPAAREPQQRVPNIRIAAIGPFTAEEFQKLQSISIDAATQHRAVEIHAIGAAPTDVFTAPKSNLVLHNQAEPEEAKAVLDWLKPHAVLFCVTEPYSYSYRMADALESGLPIIATKSGAYASQLAGRQQSWTVDGELSSSEWNELIERTLRPYLTSERQNLHLERMPVSIQ